MESEVLHLNESMERNYHALQNFFQDNVVERSGCRKGFFSKTAKRRASKNRRVLAQNEKCLDCGVHFPFIDGTYPTATVDHVIPHRYGSNLTYNGEFVCSPCNQAREKNRLFHIKRFFGCVEEPV